MAEVNLTEIGRVGLSGWRGKVGQRIAGPVSRRTRLSQEQVEAVIGVLFVALSIWQFITLMRRLVEAGRTTPGRGRLGLA